MKPLFHTLDSAIRAALRFGTAPQEMVRSKWCETYQCSLEQFDAALLRAVTTVPPNSVNEEGFGK